MRREENEKGKIVEEERRGAKRWWGENGRGGRRGVGESGRRVGGEEEKERSQRRFV